MQAPRLAGPLPARNQHPAQLTVLHMDPAGVESLPAGEWSARGDIAYTSLFLAGSNGQLGAAERRFAMDGEYLRATARTRIGLGGGFELGLELPLAHTTGGFLDGFVIGYHDTLGLPDQGRDDAEKHQFAVAATTDSGAWQIEQSTCELLDVPISLTWQALAPGRGPGVALRGAVELPTGDDDAGYGNGDWDAALGVLLEHRAAGLGFYAHAQHTWAGTPGQARAAGFEFADVTSAGCGVEWPWTESLTAIVQVEAETSTLRNLGFPRVADEQVLLWSGGRIAVTDRWALELAIGEDLSGYVSPDFTIWIGCAPLPIRRGP